MKNYTVVEYQKDGKLVFGVKTKQGFYIAEQMFFEGYNEKIFSENGEFCASFKFENQEEKDEFLVKFLTLNAMVSLDMDFDFDMFEPFEEIQSFVDANAYISLNFAFVPPIDVCNKVIENINEAQKEMKEYQEQYQELSEEDKLHQEAIDLMDDINHRLGTNHWMSLDEFYDAFSYQFTDDEEEKVTALLKRFEEL